VWLADLHAHHANGRPLLVAVVVLDVDLLAALLRHDAGVVTRASLPPAEHPAAIGNAPRKHRTGRDAGPIAVIEVEQQLAVLHLADDARIPPERLSRPVCQPPIPDVPGRGAAVQAHHAEGRPFLVAVVVVNVDLLAALGGDRPGVVERPPLPPAEDPA